MNKDKMVGLPRRHGAGYYDDSREETDQLVTLCCQFNKHTLSKNHYKIVYSYRRAVLYMFARKQALGLELVRMMDTLLFKDYSINFHNMHW